MTKRSVVTDDATGLEIPVGTVYYAVTVEYTENDAQYNTGIPKYEYKDSADWNAVGTYIKTQLPANATKVSIQKVIA